MTSKHDYADAKQHARITGWSLASIALIMMGLLAGTADADARGSAGGGVRAASAGGGRMAQSSVSGTNHAGRGSAGNHSGNRINTGDVNIGNDINVDIDGGFNHHGGGYYYHPIATGIAIGAVAATTAAVLGASYYALPPGCTTVYRNGMSYYYCGTVYYQKSWYGDDVVYVVVNP